MRTTYDVLTRCWKWVGVHKFVEFIACESPFLSSIRNCRSIFTLNFFFHVIRMLLVPVLLEWIAHIDAMAVQAITTRWTDEDVSATLGTGMVTQRCLSTTLRCKA